MLSVTLSAQLQVSVSMEFTKVIAMDTTLPMQTINILTDNLGNMALVNELKHCHVSLGWSCACNGIVKVSSLPEREFSLSLCNHVFKLFLIGSSLPAAGAGRQDSIKSTSVIRDSASS